VLQTAGAAVLEYPASYILTLRKNPQLVRDSLTLDLERVTDGLCYIVSRVDTDRTLLKLMCKYPQSDQGLYPEKLLAWTEDHREYCGSLGYDSVVKKPKASLAGSQDLSSSQWGLDRIDSRGRRLDAHYNYVHDGSGMVVYVIDTGIKLDHPEFENRAVFGINAVGDGIDTDCDGHGTHVAGTIGGKTVGVAKGVTLVAVKGLDCEGDGSVFSIMTAIDYIMADASTRLSRRDRAIINASIGTGKNAQLNLYFSLLRDTGAAITVAAGNEGGDACLYSPSSVHGVLSVASSDDADRLSSFSNFGPCVNMTAPGSRILSADISSSSGLSFKSGTSMASPHVAGVLALVMGQNQAISGHQAQDIVVTMATSDVVSMNSAYREASFGRPSDVAPWALLYSKIDLSPPPPPPPPLSPIFPQPGDPPPPPPPLPVTNPTSEQSTFAVVASASERVSWATLPWVLCIVLMVMG
jgi:subtilisin family serine protease